MANREVRTPETSYAPSKVFPTGRTAPGTSANVSAEGTQVNLAQQMGYNRELQEPELIESVKGAHLITDSGFYPDVVNFIYYVRQSDYTVLDNGTRLYVDDSLGRHKKIVTFKKDALPTDTAQVTIMYYQVAPFPTKITAILTYYEPVSIYLLGGTGKPTYDSNSATQTSHLQNI